MSDEPRGYLSAQTPDASVAAMGSSLCRQQYLFGFAGQAEVSSFLRMQAAKAEAARIPEILQAWSRAQPRVQHLLAAESGLADTIAIEEPPSELEPLIQHVLSDDLFQKTFQHETAVAVVEIDKLIAGQRHVNLDYVDRILQSFPEDMTIEALGHICLSLERTMNPIQHLELAPNTHIFSSPTADLRFLGAYEKTLTKEDLAYAQAGGLPMAAIISFVGYGAAPINVFLNNRRVVLNNGFHRVYALRARGITKIPVVVQFAHNATLEFPLQVAGIDREYLLGHDRPVLMKDFFEEELSTVVRMQNRIRVVTLQVNPGQHDVPT